MPAVMHPKAHGQRGGRGGSPAEQQPPEKISARGKDANEATQAPATGGLPEETTQPGLKVLADQLLRDESDGSNMIEEFICKICLVHVVGSTPKLTRCSHLFCGDCLAKWFSAQPGTQTWAQRAQSAGSVPCPVCKESLNPQTDLFAIKAGGPSESALLWRMLCGLKICCANDPRCRQDGKCDWVGDYGNYPKHIQACKNVALGLRSATPKTPPVAPAPAPAPVTRKSAASKPKEAAAPKKNPSKETEKAGRAEDKSPQNTSGKAQPAQEKAATVEKSPKKPAAEPAKEVAAVIAKEDAVEPAKAPAAEAAKEPAAEPAKEPTPQPAKEDAVEPTVAPTVVPTVEPTVGPAAAPVAELAAEPSPEPSAKPTPQPTVEEASLAPVLAAKESGDLNDLIAALVELKKREYIRQNGGDPSAVAGDVQPQPSVTAAPAPKSASRKTAPQQTEPQPTKVAAMPSAAVVSESMAKQPAAAEAPLIMRVINPFVDASSSRLSLGVGDTVEVLERHASGWVYGRKATNLSGSGMGCTLEGWFPYWAVHSP